jgi:anti-sigma regulatory factor (Ser/Thr protein kinase)
LHGSEPARRGKAGCIGTAYFGKSNGHERTRQMTTGQRTGADGGTASGRPGHLMLPCASPRECANALLEVLGDGLRRSEPLAVAVTQPLAACLMEALAGHPAQVEYIDVTRLARNPARLISAISDLAAGHRDRVWWIEEPMWPGRSPAEAAEVARHEALVNVAFRDLPVQVVCVYQQHLLSPAELRYGESTHPCRWLDGHADAAPGYAGPGAMPAGADLPLDPPPPDAQRISYGWALGPVRAAVAETAADLPGDRARDLVLATHEAASNSLLHADGSGVLHTWHTADEVICDIRDSGTVTDPLAGRRRSAADARGHGLWVVNQICDLVQLRTRPGSTTLRLHMRAPGRVAVSVAGGSQRA